MSKKISMIGIVGLGYVGLPLAEAFASHYSVVGYDVNKDKVADIRATNPGFTVTNSSKDLGSSDIIIITVPTPVTQSKEPDVSYVVAAAETIGKVMKSGVIVVLESTVYPGVTEEVLASTLEKSSDLVCGTDFFVGYSPERVNPGDPDHTIDKITKIVSGQTSEVTKTLAEVYGKITTVYEAETIQTAEAAKVIENIQRDLNIALVNELALIFEKIGLDTKSVLQAAGTKWNFHKYTPGLVGGHCIPVDPYYLVHKAKLVRHHPQVILAGRSVNDAMPSHVFNLTLQALNQIKKPLHGAKILVLGLTFKENVPDTRENPVKEIIRLLHHHHADVYGYDPLLTSESIKDFKITPVSDLHNITVDAVILTVVHDVFRQLSIQQMKMLMHDPGIVVDVRGFFNRTDIESNAMIYQTL